ncbi:hypothetical protein ABT095_25705 [Kitasatospora sp. NPDC002227]|uniref:hypothetical protein n=1 Tax=Kitasatospora sp. NPDC002227 TaxID=3154773 RepID=UPI00331B9655
MNHTHASMNALLTTPTEPGQEPVAGYLLWKTLADHGLNLGLVYSGGGCWAITIPVPGGGQIAIADDGTVGHLAKEGQGWVALYYPTPTDRGIWHEVYTSTEGIDYEVDTIACVAAITTWLAARPGGTRQGENGGRSQAHRTLESALADELAPGEDPIAGRHLYQALLKANLKAEPMYTGGGCFALQLDAPGGDILLTDDGAQIVHPASEHTYWKASFYPDLEESESEPIYDGADSNSHADDTAACVQAVVTWLATH